MSKRALFANPVSRVVAATAGVLVVATLVTAGAAAYLPLSASDRIAVPVIVFPITWVVLFLYALMADSVRSVWLLLGALFTVHVAFVAYLLLAD